MDIQPTSQQPISDDQELAKVLAGINQQADSNSTTPPTTDEVPTAPEPETTVATPATPVEEPATSTIAPTPPVAAPSVTPLSTTPPSVGSSDLDSIKKDALSELRPLVDKLNVAPEEKFDTYLLLLRSTDDQALIAPAHEAARNITDEARRAQALLDIIKEIDYLSGPQQPAI